MNPEYDPQDSYYKNYYQLPQKRSHYQEYLFGIIASISILIVAFAILAFIPLHKHTQNNSKNFTSSNFSPKKCPENINVYFDLSFSVAHDSFNTIQYLVNCGADLNKRGGNPLRETPLVTAIDYEKFDVVRLLVDRGADINPKSPGEETPLAAAIRCRERSDNRTTESFDVVRLLVDRGADINQKTIWGGSTPLALAKEKGDDQVTEFLWSRGARNGD